MTVNNVYSTFFRLFQAEDYIDEILNGESYADSLKYDANAMADIRIKEEPQVFSEAEAKDRQKKDNHNMSKKGKDSFDPLIQTVY
jgi:hypothetical protein